MKRQNTYRFFTYTFFLMATVTVTVAFVELLLNVFQLSVLNQFYTPGRLMELSSTMLMFVIALVLVQIKHAIMNSDGQ